MNTRKERRRRRASIACALLLALIAAPALAAPSATQVAKPAATPKPAPQTKVLMWQLRSATATVYLLGSVHIGSADAYPLDPRIERAFAESDTLVLEIPLDADAVAKAGALLQKSGLYGPDDSLDKHLDPPTMAKLKTAVSAAGIPSDLVMRMRPWFAAMMLALTRLQAAGYQPQYGIDTHFFNARKDRRFQALETVEEQASMLSDLPPAQQLEHLRQTLDELPRITDVMRDAFVAWRRGDSKAIDELMLAPLRREHPALFRRLFVERNRRMASAIERLLTGKGTAFVVVGAGHLIGKDSVIRLLTKPKRVPKQL